MTGRGCYGFAAGAIIESCFIMLSAFIVLSAFLMLSAFIIESEAIAGGAIIADESVVSTFFSPHAATATTAATIKNFRIASPLVVMT